VLNSNRLGTGWGPEPIEIPNGDGNKEISQFLSEIFTQQIAQDNTHLYKLTVAVAEKLFNDDLFDGLIYPTVAMQANADNFALKPRYADRNLRFLKAECLRIDRVRDSGYDINGIDSATSLDDNGNIQWTGHPSAWVLRNQGDQLTFREENGDWVARDKDGNIVEPE
jgi:hypothetical protein